ncbi:hypothetical protein [Alteromonas gracilis]|uniref:hypothetical protein n=1 Tax=Alteromonas gracilis TaxID=1479524 RepID=UPI003734C9C7
MLLGLYLFVMTCLLITKLTNSYIGLIILGIVALVSYITTVSIDITLSKKKRALFAGIGFVLISTVSIVGMVNMEQKPVTITDYLSPLLLVFCHPIVVYLKKGGNRHAG